MNFHLQANEVVIKAGDSSHLVENEEPIKGKLIVTNQRIYFRPALQQTQTNPMEILPENIRELLFFNSFKVIPNGLSIVTRNGSQLKFKVKQRQSWISLINRMYC